MSTDAAPNLMADTNSTLLNKPKGLLLVEEMELKLAKEAQQIAEKQQAYAEAQKQILQQYALKLTIMELDLKVKELRIKGKEQELNAQAEALEQEIKVKRSMAQRKEDELKTYEADLLSRDSVLSRRERDVCQAEAVLDSERDAIKTVSTKIEETLKNIGGVEAGSQCVRLIQQYLQLPVEPAQEAESLSLEEVERDSCISASQADFTSEPSEAEDKACNDSPALQQTDDAAAEQPNGNQSSSPEPPNSSVEQTGSPSTQRSGSRQSSEIQNLDSRQISDMEAANSSQVASTEASHSTQSSDMESQEGSQAGKDLGQAMERFNLKRQFSEGSAQKSQGQKSLTPSLHNETSTESKRKSPSSPLQASSQVTGGRQKISHNAWARSQDRSPHGKLGLSGNAQGSISSLVEGGPPNTRPLLRGPDNSPRPEISLRSQVESTGSIRLDGPHQRPTTDLVRPGMPPMGPLFRPGCNPSWTLCRPYYATQGKGCLNTAPAYRPGWNSHTTHARPPWAGSQHSTL